MPRRSFSVYRRQTELSVTALLACCAPWFLAVVQSHAQDKNGAQARVIGEDPAAIAHPTQSPELPTGVRQLLIGVTEGWNSSRGKLWRFERSDSSASTPTTTASGEKTATSAATEKAASDASNTAPESQTATPAVASSWTRLTKESGVDILLGRNGLAWGRGALTIPQALLDRHAGIKREGDRRAPAGCFSIPKIYGNDAELPGKATFPYRQVSRWDAWPDDPKNPYYNRHVIIDPKQVVPSWFEKQRMRQGDPAYRWLIEVRHNSDPPQPGAGSAIFFHVRRGPDRTTSGCTTMSEGNLSAVVQWLKADARPHYALLPQAEYEILAPIWKLPPLP